MQRLIDWQVLVVPACRYHSGMSGPLTIMDLPDGSTIAWIDGQRLRPGTILDTEEAVNTAIEIWEEILACALPVDLSGEMIAAIADELPQEP